MSGHTPEPWKAREHPGDDGWFWWIYGGMYGSGQHASPCAATPCIAGVDRHCHGGKEEVAANARRIVACVNACQGMSDPAAEIAALRRAVEVLGRHVYETAWQVTDEGDEVMSNVAQYVRDNPIAAKAVQEASDLE